MRTALLLALACWTTPLPGKSPNVLLLCVDDLRPELNCYGVDYIKSPHIDSLADTGRLFTHHYVQAPTCGASRYALLTGNYGPSDNGALLERARKIQSGARVTPSLPAHFRQNGYTTVSIGKISHHPGGRGGKDWTDSDALEMPHSWDRHLMPCGEWLHPRGAMHGLANGEIRKRAKDMAVFQSLDGPDDIYPDGRITNEALKQLDQLGEAARRDHQPFFLAVGWLKPHLPLGAPARYMEPYRTVELPPIPHPQKPAEPSTWHPSWEFRKYQSWGKDAREDLEFATAVRKHYAACVSYADAQVGRVLAKLDELGLRENTLIVLWGDHGWHLGEHAIWGKHSLFEEALHAPLIISGPGVMPQGPAISSIVETIDIYPTLCDFANLQPTDELDGRSLRDMLTSNDASAGGEAIAYTEKAETIRTPEFRLIRHRDEGQTIAVELYDHRTAAGETHNIAERHPEVVKQLDATLDARLGR